MVVDSIGRGRHMAIGSNGDIYLHLSKLALMAKELLHCVILRGRTGGHH